MKKVLTYIFGTIVSLFVFGFSFAMYADNQVTNEALQRNQLNYQQEQANKISEQNKTNEILQQQLELQKQQTEAAQKQSEETQSSKQPVQPVYRNATPNIDARAPQVKSSVPTFSDPPSLPTSRPSRVPINGTKTIDTTCSYNSLGQYNCRTNY